MLTSQFGGKRHKRRHACSERFFRHYHINIAKAVRAIADKADKAKYAPASREAGLRLNGGNISGGGAGKN